MNNDYYLNIQCRNNTRKICEEENLMPHKSLKLSFDKNFKYNKKYKKSNIKIFNMDTIKFSVLHCHNPLVLNLADNNRPGGCVDSGSRAQEESLFRRTNYN